MTVGCITVSLMMSWCHVYSQRTKMLKSILFMNQTWFRSDFFQFHVELSFSCQKAKDFWHHTFQCNTDCVCHYHKHNKLLVLSWLSSFTDIYCTPSILISIESKILLFISLIFEHSFFSHFCMNTIINDVRLWHLTCGQIRSS